MATLFRKPRAVVDAHPRTAIIDIGSNSIRLVVYQGPARMPSILFNEKVMAGLGRGLAATGAIDAAAMARAQGAVAFGPITAIGDLETVFAEAIAAVEAGALAVVDVRVEPGYTAATTAAMTRKGD